MATSRVYDLCQSITHEDSEKQIEIPDEQDQEASKLAEEMMSQRERDRQPGATDEQPVGTAGEAQTMPSGTAILGWVILAAILIGGGIWYTSRRMNRTRPTAGGPPR